MQVNSLPTELSGKHPPPQKKKQTTEKWTQKKKKKEKRQSKGEHRSKTRDEALQSERTV